MTQIDGFEIRAAVVDDLNSNLNLNNLPNPIVLKDWLSLAVENLYEPAYATIENFLTIYGHRSSVRQIFRSMAKTPEGLELGRRIYKNTRGKYHYMTSTAVDAILGWDDM